MLNLKKHWGRTFPIVLVLCILSGVFYAHRDHHSTEPVIAHCLPDLYPGDVPLVELPQILQDAADRYLREDAAFVTLDEARTLSRRLNKVTGS